MRSNPPPKTLPPLPLATVLLLLLLPAHNSPGQPVSGHGGGTPTSPDCNECQKIYYNDCVPNPDKNGQPCGEGKICCGGECVEPCDCKNLNTIWKADTAPILYLDNLEIESPSGPVPRGSYFNLVIKYDIKPYNTRVVCKCSHDKSKTEQGAIVSITPSTGKSDQGRHFAGYGSTVTIRGNLFPNPVTVTVRCPSSSEDQVFENVKPHYVSYKAVIDTKNRPRRSDDDDSGGGGGGGRPPVEKTDFPDIPRPTPAPAPTPTPRNCDEIDCSGAQPFQHIHAPLFNKPFTPSPNPHPTPTPRLAPGLNVRFETRGNSYWRPGWREFCTPNQPCNTNTDTYLTMTSSRTVSGCNKGCVDYTRTATFQIDPSTNRYINKITGCHDCGHSGLWLDEIITPTQRTQQKRHSFSTHTYTTRLSDRFITADFLALGPKYLHDWKSQIDFAVPVEHFNSGGWWWGYGHGYYYHHHYYGIKNRYQGGGVVVAVQRLGRYQYPDGSRYENWLTYSESRLQFEWGPTKDPKKPGPLKDTNQRYGVTYLVVFFPDDNPFTPDHDESQDIEVLETFTWDGQATQSPIKTFSPQALIPNKTGLVVLLTMDILEVASDQIPGNRANRLPSAYYQDYPNNPMLMATRSGTSAHLVVRAKIPVSSAEGFRIGIRESAVSAKVADARVNPILGCAKANNDPDWTDLQFSALNGSKSYEVVGGYDKNKNNKLEPDEVITVFRKTPPIKKDGTAYTGSDKTFKLLDKIVIVTEEDYSDSRDEAEKYGTNLELQLVYPNGTKLMQAFTRGDTFIRGVTTEMSGVFVDASIIPSPDGLSHPVGAKWNTSNVAATYRFIFPANSDLSQKMTESNGFRAAYRRALDKYHHHMLAMSTINWSYLSIPLNDNEIDFSKTDPRSDPHASIGKCRFAGVITVAYRRDYFGNLQAQVIHCAGQADDLFDFAYGTPKVVIKIFNLTIYEIDAKHGARTQAGHATLTSLPHKNAGRLFFTRVKFNNVTYFEYP